ncbi:MAG: hypothetical protein HY825_02275 [Acidobacteria bacterium]|nr:hypothetical protein [Acidobacteriota bacterium]
MTAQNIRLWLLAPLAAAGAGCGSEASLPGVGDTPYRIELSLLDPSTGEVLRPPAAGDAALWPLGLPDGPVLSVTYWAVRTTPPLSLIVRAVGAGLAGGTTVAGTGGDGGGGGDPCAADPFASGCPCDVDVWDPACVCYDDPCLTGCPGWYDPDSYFCGKAGGTSEIVEATVPLEIIDTDHRTVKISVLPPASAGLAQITVVLGGASESIPVEFTASDVAIHAPATGVADGATETPLTVTGLAGQIVEVETSRGTFVAPGFTGHASLLLVADAPGSIEGTAVVGLISATRGPAVVSAGGSAADWVRIDFEDVLLEFGTPTAIDFVPGKLVHEICVATNSAKGQIRLQNTATDAVLLDTVPQPVLAASGALPSSCPGGSFAGYALFRWAAGDTTDALTATWTGPTAGTTATASARVEGVAFAGYRATLESTQLDFGDPYLLLLQVRLEYLAAGGLSTRPADGVGLTFIVASTFGATPLMADAETSPEGTANAVYSVVDGDVLEVFVQPEEWSSIDLGSAP